MRKLGLLVLALLLSLFLAACDDASVEKVDNTEETTTEEDNGDNNEEEASEEEEANDDLVVGDTVNFDGLEITLNEVRIEPGGEFDEPSEDQFIVANMTIENTTDEEETISSIMNIELKDDEGYSYSTTILLEGTKGQLDGSIEPGGTMRGEIPFDVPTSDTYELHFSDPFKTGKAIWTIPSSDLE